MKKIVLAIVFVLFVFLVACTSVSADRWDEPKKVVLSADSENAGCYDVLFTYNYGYEQWEYFCAKEPRSGSNVEGFHVHTQHIQTQSQDLELSAKPGWHWELKTKFLDREAWYLIKNK